VFPHRYCTVCLFGFKVSFAVVVVAAVAVVVAAVVVVVVAFAVVIVVFPKS